MVPVSYCQFPFISEKSPPTDPRKETLTGEKKMRSVIHSPETEIFRSTRDFSSNSLVHFISPSVHQFTSSSEPSNSRCSLSEQQASARSLRLPEGPSEQLPLQPQPLSSDRSTPLLLPPDLSQHHPLPTCQQPQNPCKALASCSIRPPPSLTPPLSASLVVRSSTR